MSINTLFFAQLAEQAGLDALQVKYEAGMSARSLIDRLEGKVATEALDTLRHDVVMLSVNKKMAEWDAPLSDGDEVGFLPPFSGG